MNRWAKLLKRFFWILVDLAAVLLIFSTVMGFLGRAWWFFDWFSHFRVQYLFVAFLLGAIYLMGKHKSMTLITGILFLINASLILPLYIAPATALPSGDNYRILLSNVLTENPNHAALSNLIAETDPDFVMLLEVNQTWLDDLNLTALGYSYFFAQPRDDNFGIAFYSRYPLEPSEPYYFGRLDLPSIVAHLTLDDRPVMFVLSHPVPPKSEGLTLHRGIQMDEITAFIAGQDVNTILAGDFNASSWSPYFKDWLRTTGLRDSRLGFGVQSTWPARSWWLRVPIDHILTSPEIVVQTRSVGPDIGSDHFPVMMDFSLSE